MPFPVWLVPSCIVSTMTSKHPKLPSWYRSRCYLHFDLPIGYKKAKAIVTNAERIRSHAFYPLIRYTITAGKVAKDPDTYKLIQKSKERPIAYAAHIDSHIYAYYSEKLTDAYEFELKDRGIESSVLAFRSLGKSNIEFAKDAFDNIRAYGECGVVGLDISGFFDNLDHSILKEKWAGILGGRFLPNDHFNIYKSLSQWSSVDKDELYQTLGISAHNPKNGRYRVCSPEQFRKDVRGGGLVSKNLKKKGIPQGSPISALLSNIYMIDFDCEVNEKITGIGGRYYRYCDDMLFIIPLECRDKIAGIIAKKIKNDLKVEINTTKTAICTYQNVNGKLLADKPLQYLGFLFDGEQITIRSAALARYSERMKRGVYLAKRTKKKRDQLKIASGRKPRELYKRKLYEKYSHFGQRNFVRYGLRAAKIMDSNAIRRQLKPLWGRLKEEINK